MGGVKLCNGKMIKVRSLEIKMNSYEDYKSMPMSSLVCWFCIQSSIQVLTEAVLWTGRGGAFVGLCGCRGLTEAPEGGLKN